MYMLLIETASIVTERNIASHVNRTNLWSAVPGHDLVENHRQVTQNQTAIQL